ncbi:ATP-binding cassette domain-containing protein [Paenibacillus sp. sptzw28]|uniref:ATP-binding cassette domain-containing protein n=1 Tax=Paenibacillus sp. sptzw28 TaxID=715179 RepID=UPI001C6EC7E6|nr:ATP-binding cassette domain-containing protein [Paenibacillus sp. sptzw28]QYR22457.1 ATP-binding cassette domain-containing protein [Paenibacillus sp. sptzw28]
MSGKIISGDFILSDISVFSIYDEGEPTSRLENIDLTFSPGEWLNIVGVNGSGKSTLARLLAGLMVEGAQGTLRRGFAGEGPSPYVMQNPDAQLFGETPREEIMFSLEWLDLPSKDILERTDRILEVTGMRAFADHTWDKLSGGQRQLAAVAAAAAGEAALIVFDEATSMLDDASRGKVHQLAKRLNERGTAVVWVTQRLEELDPSYRVVALQGGKIVYDGEGRRFLYGDNQSAELQAPCEQCGLRLPYMASLAAELSRLGQLHSPLPVTMEEWRKALDRG